MEATEHVPHMCGTCRRVVNWFEPVDGSPGRWVHSAQDLAADHAVEPVPVDGTVRGRCDFCSVDNPTWVLPARPFEVVKGPGMGFHSVDDTWAACDACAELIRANHWLALVDRVLDTFPTEDGKPTLSDQFMLVALYNTLRRNVTGPLRPISEWED